MSATPHRTSASAGNGDAAMRANAAHPLRPISFGDPDVTIERHANGTVYLRPKSPLGDYPRRITDRLHHWTDAAPERVFMAERAGVGWRRAE